MDLQKFREKLKEYRNRIGISQEELADGLYVHKSMLSDILNGRRPISADFVHRIIHYLAERQAIRGQSQAFELLRFTDSEDFSEADWKSPPLAELALEPLPTTPSQQSPQHETPSGPSNEALTLEDEKNNDKLHTNISSSTEERATTAAESQPEQGLSHSQLEKDLRITLQQIANLQISHPSQKEKLESAYRQIIIITEARLHYAGVVEAIRKFNGDIASEALPQVKADLDTAEQRFNETEVRYTLLLLDNNKVWAHYYTGTHAFKKYKKHTEDLVARAIKPLPPLVVRVPRIDVMLAGDSWRDDDPTARNLYIEMDREFNAMLRTMNRRLRL